MQGKRLPEPWKSLLEDVDAALAAPTDLHCMGGFVLEIAYGLSRTTVDLDFLAITPAAQSRFIEELAGKGSTLFQKHGIYLQHVTVLTAYPEDYEKRLIALFSGAYRFLKLWALEPHDLALTKIERNWDLDRADATSMAKAGLLDADTFRRRYESEMRPYLADPARHDLTVRLWAEIIHSAGSER